MSKLWTVVKAAGNHPLPRAYHSAVEANGKIYVIAGKGPNDKALDSSLYILNTAGLKSWNLPKVTGVAPTPRHSHSATIVDNKIYIFGGHGERFLNDWFVLNCATLAWSQPRLNGSPPLPRSNHTATAFGKKIVVFGGTCLNFSKSFNDLHIWDIEQLQWSTIQASGAIPSPRFNHIAEVIDDKLYVIGGTDGKRLFNDVHIFDLTNNVWSSPQTIGGIPGVSGASSFVHERKIIFFGGETSNGVSDVCFAFQPDNAQFCESKETVSRTGTAIAGRDGHRICCTSKNVVYLLGGRGPNTADLVVMYNLTPSTLTFQTSSYVPSEGDEQSIVISEVIQGENSLISDIQRSEVLTSSGNREQASHNELLKLKANLDALKEKRELVAKRAQQEAEAPIDNVEFAKLSGEIQSLKEEVKNAKSTTEQSNAALAETNKKLEEANKKLVEKDTEINSLKSLSNEKNLLERKILDLQSEVQSSKGSVSSDLQRISSLTHELELASQEKANLKNTISELQFQIAQDSLRSSQSQTEHNLNIEKLEHQLASSSTEIQQINNSFEAQIAEFENTIRQLTEEKAEIKNSKDHEVAKLKQQIEQNMLQTIQNSSEQQLKEEFEKKFQEIDDERNSLLSEINTLNESHSKQLSELKSALSSLKNEHDQLQRTHGNLERQLAESNNQNESKSKFISQLEEQISTLNSKRSVQVEDFNSQIANYQTQITTLNDTVNGYQSQIESLKSSIKSSDNSAELKDKVAQIEAASAQQIQQLKEQFAITEAALIDELNTYKSQIEELQETLLNYHAEIERLNIDFQQQATELQARIGENKKLQNSLNTLAEQELSGGGSDIEVARYLDKIREQEEEISRLEGEVEQWMTASEELQKLGEDAVAEITLEADRLREEVNQWKKAVEEQTQRRREAEAELLNSESKLNDLDSMLRRLLGE